MAASVAESGEAPFRRHAHSAARIAVAAQPAVAALISYCRAEATALLVSNRSILDALVEALIERGTLDSGEVDTIIADAIGVSEAEAERVRRADWQSRIANAQTFEQTVFR